MNLDAEFESTFETALETALTEEAEQELVGQQDSVLHEFVQAVHDRLREFGRRHDYDVEPAIDSLVGPEVDRSGGSLTVTVGWADEQMARWEFGTEPHTIRGDPLAFVWEDPPGWVREEFDQARSSGGQFRSGWKVFLPEVDHPGTAESRAIRDSLNELRSEMES